jgi:hypothetical protein
MLKRPDAARPVFTARAAGSNAFQLWLAAFAGHRIAGTDLPGIADWLTRQGLENARIESGDAPPMYLHLHAVTDRVPTDADIALLKRPRGPYGLVDQRWAASALLIRSAMEDRDSRETHRQAETALRGWGEARRNLFILPAYAWVAWQATDGKDEALREAGEVTLEWDFDHLLARSMVLALEGRTAESLRFLTAARYELSTMAARYNELVDRPIPAPYQYALAGYLMYRKTRHDAYRQGTLRFVQAYQKVHPFLGWLYGLEALLERTPGPRLVAACRAHFLDRHSHFLKLADVPGVNAQACRSALWPPVQNRPS